MKKGKRSAGWQEEGRGPARRIELDLSDDETEGIIDLDDILEVDDEGLLEGEDQLDLDVEILDADADLDADDLNAGLSDDEEDLLEEDFLGDFSVSAGVTRKGREEEETLVDEGEDEETLDFESLLKIEMEEEGEAGVDDLTPVDDMVADAAGAAPAVVEQSVGDDGPGSMEPFVARIEERLIDAVRQIVEERLPEIVRSLLEEQIEKLKGER